MASLITLRRQIASIKNTRQITKAMQLVSASKLRRAQEYAAKSRDYEALAFDMMSRLSAMNEVEQLPLFKRREVKNKLYIIVSSNTGLAGAYNANVLKLLHQSLNQDRSSKVNSHVITIGSKAAQFVRRLAEVDLMAVYPPFPDQPSVDTMRPILNTIIEKYDLQKVDEVQLIYTKFKSSISQEARQLQLLPAQLIDLPKNSSVAVSNFEPDAETVVAQITARLIEAQLWQAVLESMASEHAMRMISTKNATDNANQLINDYTLELNTARQAAITQELAEISGGVEALSS
jgi:F-type H+-transporting ATPase subunit gamma